MAPVSAAIEEVGRNPFSASMSDSVDMVLDRFDLTLIDQT
jgi:hypothetical protein